MFVMPVVSPPMSFCPATHPPNHKPPSLPSLCFVGGLYLFSMADCLFYGLFNYWLPASTQRDNVWEGTKLYGFFYLVQGVLGILFLRLSPQLA